MKLVRYVAPSPTLERQVHVRYAVGSSADRRHDARVSAQVAIWRLFVVMAFTPIAIIAFSASLGTSRTVEDDAKALVKQYAFEAFPQWASLHFEESCPRSIAELAPIISRDISDPWGNPLEMRCGDGIRGAFIRSAGADRRFDTPDDITSND